MATTEEQMMIMGLCLQGILANPSLTTGGFTSNDPDVAQRGAEAAARELEHNIKLAHRYAAKLMPLAEDRPEDDATIISRMTHQAYELLRTGEVEGAGTWGEFHHVRLSATGEEEEDPLDGVFERVTRFYYDPGHPPESIQDWIICTVVALGRRPEGEDHGA